MITGTVKWFNETKGFGFIEAKGQENDVFVHITAVKEAGINTLKEGEEVSFEITENKGKACATNLKTL